MYSSILIFLKQAWEKLKKIFVEIFNFIKNIADWFRARFLRVKKKHPNAKAISLKIEELLKEGNFNELNIGLESGVVNTFYDTGTGELIVDETQVIGSDSLDVETEKAFGDKGMLVLS